MFRNRIKQDFETPQHRPMEYDNGWFTREDTPNSPFSSEGWPDTSEVNERTAHEALTYTSQQFDFIERR